MKKRPTILFSLLFLTAILVTSLTAATYDRTPYFSDSRIAYPPHSYDAYRYPYHTSYTQYQRVDRNYFAPAYTVYQNYQPRYYTYPRYYKTRNIRYISYSPRYTSFNNDIYLDSNTYFGYKKIILEDGRPSYTTY
jgi:hypothetical protein